LEVTELIEHIKLALKPEVQNWVLFSNGTVIIINDIADGEDFKEKALRYMGEFGPVHPASDAGDFGTVKLVNTEGWMVTGHGSRMYTYVHPQELQEFFQGNNPHDLSAGIYGRYKRHKDSEGLKIIHVNSGNQSGLKDAQQRN
jgi:hypothetical protein